MVQKILEFLARETRPKRRRQFTMRAFFIAAVFVATFFAALQLPEVLGVAAVVGLVWLAMACVYWHFRSLAPLAALAIGPMAVCLPRFLDFSSLGRMSEPAQLPIAIAGGLAWGVLLSLLIALAARAERRWNRSIPHAISRAVEAPVSTKRRLRSRSMRLAIAAAAMHAVVCGVAFAGLWFEVWVAVIVIALVDLPLAQLLRITDLGPPVPCEFLRVLLPIALLGTGLYAGLGALIGYLLDRVERAAFALEAPPPSPLPNPAGDAAPEKADVGEAVLETSRDEEAETEGANSSAEIATPSE